MANCIKCGRKLPMFTFGKHRNVCRWCVEYEAMQNGEVDDDARQHVMPAPWTESRNPSMVVTQIFAGICAAVFIGMALATEGKSVMKPPSSALIAWGANFGPLTLSGDWWRLVTSMFVHIGIIHIALNMWCLWDLGALAESLYGRWTFAAIYLICGVAGSVASLAWNPVRVSAGASGAIFGIAGALIASLKLGRFSLPQAAVKSTLSSLVSFAVYNLIFGAMMGFVDNTAHLGGLVAGLIMGALIAVAASEREHGLRRFTIVVLVFLLVLGGGAWVQKARGAKAQDQLIAILMKLGMYDQAARQFEKRVQANPNDIDARLTLAFFYGQANRKEDQEAELKRVLGANPPKEAAQSARYELATLYTNQGRTADARQLYSEMFAADPNSADAHLGLGRLLATEKQHEKAVEELEIAANLAPASEEIQQQLGNAYLNVKRYDAAIKALNKALEIDPRNAGAAFALADAYEAKGMTEEASQARQYANRLTSRD